MYIKCLNFNPRSLTGATFDIHVFSTQIRISIHAPSRERRCCSISIGIPHIFQSTLPRGSDYLTATELLSIVEFQSTLPRGSDASALIKPLIRKDFNPRSLAGATIPLVGLSRRSDYFNPRSLAGATIPLNLTCVRLAFQSTLPRGSDGNQQRPLRGNINFNPRSLAGATLTVSVCTIVVPVFQSTLPRGSDLSGGCGRSGSPADFNPRSLAGATMAAALRDKVKAEFQSTLPRGSDVLCLYFRNIPTAISIHAPSRERHRIQNDIRIANEFQSTLPRGSDCCCRLGCCYFWISIHAPSRERLGLIGFCSSGNAISIHAPSRERLHINKIILHSKHFNPRSLAGATPEFLGSHSSMIFQSTLPRGSDGYGLPLYSSAVNFNPRSLAGATVSTIIGYLTATISIHAPSRERLD